MSEENMSKIVGRAVVDPEFRELLFADLEKALAGCELTDAQVIALRSLSRENLEELAHELDARIARATAQFQRSNNSQE